MDRSSFDALAAQMAASMQRLEESRDRLLLAHTRMEIAAERAELAFSRFREQHGA